MYYSAIKDCDVANGTGVRVTLFVSGCTNHCKNCFQPETWDFCNGEEFTEEVEENIIQMLSKSYIEGLTLLGGEPMEPRNQVDILPFLYKVRERLPEKDIWLFSGFTYEQLLDEGSYCHVAETEEILNLVDVLVDGRYVDELRNLALKFRGSENQRIIDVKATKETGMIVKID